MEYRENKRLNARVSLLGFGGMRFPTDGEGKIREAEAAGMLRRALEGGVDRVVILDGRIDHVMLLDAVSGQTMGTTIYRA